MASINGFKIDDLGIRPAKISFVGHKLCGSGRFSNVYTTKLISPEEKEVAIKNVWSDNEPSTVTTDKYVEVQILSKLYHPALANLLYFYSRSANDKIIHCLILEYLPTDMAKLREAGKKFDVLDAKLFTFQLFSAIAYLATKSILHMDIKPQNVIIDKEYGVLKLADFGNSRRLDTTENRGHPYQVTRFYRPPELLFGCEKFTSAIDVWSAGCVSFEFFANQALFKGKNTKDQMMLLISVLGYPTDEDVKAMEVKRPRLGRKTARGIETFTSNSLDGVVYEMLKSIIIYNPKKRKTAEEVLKLPIFDVIRSHTRIRRSNSHEIIDMVEYLKFDHLRTKESSEKQEKDKKEESEEGSSDDK